MRPNSKVSWLFVLLLSAQSLAFADERREKSEDASQVNTACATEAQTAGCGGEVVGKGLLKCLHEYRKANKSFKPSQQCHEAMEKLHHDMKEEK